ncbi:MAG: DUF5723 family protein [Salibacteraceae bacterium]
MKYIISLLSFFIIVQFAWAQPDFSIEQYGILKDSSNAKAGLWVENTFNSNVLNNSVYFNSVFGTGINRKSMQSMSQRALKTNIAGISETDRAYYSWMGKNKTDSFKFVNYVTIGSRRLFNTRFNEDAFLLLGMGNKQFAGEAADLSNTRINMLFYTQVQYGIIKQNEKGISYGGGISFLMGNSYLQFESNDAYLYTSEIGDSTFLEANGKYIQSDTAQRNLFDINGYGGSLDLFVAMPVDFIKGNEEKGTLKLEINDLGVIFWNNTVTYNIDGDIEWAGIKAPSIFDIGDSTYNSQVPSEIDKELISSSKKGSLTTSTAPRIAIYYSERLGPRIMLKNIVSYQFNSHSIPFIGSTQEFNLSKKNKPYQWNCNLYESLGGYGFLGVGLGASVSTKNFSAILGSRNIIGLLNPGYLNGFNLHCGFQWNFH